MNNACLTHLRIIIKSHIHPSISALISPSCAFDSTDRFILRVSFCPKSEPKLNQKHKSKAKIETQPEPNESNTNQTLIQSPKPNTNTIQKRYTNKISKAVLVHPYIPTLLPYLLPSPHLTSTTPAASRPTYRPTEPPSQPASLGVGKDQGFRKPQDRFDSIRSDRDDGSWVRIQRSQFSPFHFSPKKKKDKKKTPKINKKK